MKEADESQVRLIPVDKIRVVNPRVRDPKKFEKIVENIATLGLKKPITVTAGAPSELIKAAIELGFVSYANGRFERTSSKSPGGRVA